MADRQQIKRMVVQVRIIKLPISDVAKEIGCPPEFLYSDVVLLDNELKNDLSIENWDYTKADITLTGFLYGKEIQIFVRERTDKIGDFKVGLIKFLANVHLKQIFAFNQSMEIGNFKGFLDLDLDINDCKPFNARGFNKEKFFNILVEKGLIPKLNIIDPFESHSERCITNWGLYENTGDVNYLREIIQHNISCLIKECLILKNMKYFEDNYLVDNKGWLIREKTLEEKNGQIS